jgi:hypothetical protein
MVRLTPNVRGSTIAHGLYRGPRLGNLPRKEVIHPHLPIRIPCYDLTPIISPTLGLREGNTSGIGDFHGLTGGVYKTRERIHGDVLTHRY